MKLTIELEIKEHTLPDVFTELEHNLYQLHLLGFSQANIALMLNLDYNFVKRTIINKKEIIFTMIRQAYVNFDELAEKAKNGEIEVCEKWVEKEKEQK